MRIELLWPGQNIPASTSTNPVRRCRYEQAADILRRTDGNRWILAPARTARHLIEALDSVDEWEARALAAETAARQVETLRHTLHVIASLAASPSTPLSAIAQLSEQVLALTSPAVSSPPTTGDL